MHLCIVLSIHTWGGVCAHIYNSYRVLLDIYLPGIYFWAPVVYASLYQ